MENRFLLTCSLKKGGLTFFWFDTEEELMWAVKNNKSIIPMEAFEIKCAREIKIR